MKKTFSINFFYFSLLFVFIFGSSLLHPLLQSQFSLTLPFVFLSLLQTSFEVVLLFLLTEIIKKVFPRLIYLFSLGLLFFVILLHAVNFFILRLLDTSIGYLSQFLLSQNSLEEFFIALRAASLNWPLLITLVFVLLSIPLIGIGLYLWTEKKFSKEVSLNFLVYSSLGFLFLFPLERRVISHLSYDQFCSFEKKLPWTQTLLAFPQKSYSLAHSFKKPRNPIALLKKLEETDLQAAKKPNIYLFIIESFRKDYITEKSAPNLVDFSKKHINFDLSFSNANATHMSWFSILHANFPYYWNHEDSHSCVGSIPLHLLKKLGYKIHALSSAELTYYHMDERLFGKDRSLLDDFYYLEDPRADIRDQKTIDRLLANLSLKSEGECFIIFLDSTHSEYSFPKDFPILFTPVSSSVNYLSLGFSQNELPCIKNRYLNAIHYVDHLLGLFFDTLKEKELYDDSIIVISGDHGEEFYEHSALFHATHLNRYQTRVPILYKIGTKTLDTHNQMTCQMDIFPSILHYLTNVEDFSSFFDGVSLFSLQRFPYIMIAGQNFQKAPENFLIYDKNYQITCRYDFSKNVCKVYSIKNFKEEKVDIKKMDDFVSLRFQKAFDAILELQKNITIPSKNDLSVQNVTK